MVGEDGAPEGILEGFAGVARAFREGSPEGSMEVVLDMVDPSEVFMVVESDTAVA